MLPAVPSDGLADVFIDPPDPAQARTLDDLVDRLRALKVWAGNPSYRTITDQVNAVWIAVGRPAGELVGKTTVVDCFRVGRRRVNADLMVTLVQVLHPDVGYISQWRQALQVVSGLTRATAQVRVQAELPPDLATFTGRTRELDRLRGSAPPAGEQRMLIQVIAGMAGVGKTRFAIRAAHRLVLDRLAAGTAFDRVLFVNLRGFDPSQPPADPAAVLEGFLRLLGVPGSEIPHDLPARIATYRGRLARTRTLVVLDNVADAD